MRRVPKLVPKLFLERKKGSGETTGTLAITGAEDRNRTGTIVEDRRILSPVRLPVPPLRHILILLLGQQFYSIE